MGVTLYRQLFFFLLILVTCVVINRKGDPAYEIVKKVGDVDLNLTSHLIKWKNVLGRQGQADPSTIANIYLNLNYKLGGINSSIFKDYNSLLVPEEQVVIMSADVTHPDAPMWIPSIAAVVASVDPRASPYVFEIRIQVSKHEYIEGWRTSVSQLLLEFRCSTGRISTVKPQRIGFYSGGVSEGQFAKELSATRKACLLLDKDANITKIRHETPSELLRFPNICLRSCLKNGFHFFFFIFYNCSLFEVL